MLLRKFHDPRQCVQERMVPTKKGGEYLFKIHLSLYDFAQPYTVNKIVLDAGCGYGYGSYYWASNGAKNVVGIDISDEAIQYAKKQYHLENLEYRIMNVTNLDFPDESFDVVCSIEVIEHLEEYERHLLEIRRVLRPGGILVLSTPNKKLTAGQNYYHYHEFEPLELYKLLEGYFKIESLEGMRHSILFRLVSKIAPYNVITLFKGTALYRKLISKYADLQKDNVEKSSTIIAVMRK
ncbi:class I SAM-dependent methyltransferase [Candidatus Hakubella thermalkaliphila]|uniref:Methyltransferase type 11 domain-containing protein n=1 Tax=Candidatus Hakubella thermalkaliphila TaxID=2754717 RepID=A0A6V8PK57_9ACTN|nr:class I SAM-dependent methyltransferase [Candidatus Hakubella thermalkaliphila]GFP31231.1 hypothetical protein HKBW3S34_02150 [Candidatus Hakubella thermalkaliphila]